MKTTTMAVTGPVNVTQPLIMQTAVHLRDPGGDAEGLGAGSCAQQ